ncbi:hypothetical protein WJX84_000777 [Apatococcus fuscideae]|uniref:Uncharacterized protein n=1 Tax=Apatococcus fuscideae TaxID=2026836 RepID=A0AAW1S8S0_9CHLO
MRGVGPNMPLARRVASACHLSFLGRSAPESHRLLEPTTARPTLSSLSLEPDLGELPLDTGVFDLELSRHGSRHGSRNSSRHPSFNGSHTATSLRRPGQSPDGEAMDSIIEPRFKELFQIGPATPLFTGLLESVPQTFVGHPTRLALLAELLSAESVRAFKEGGWTLPPWRTVSSMLGKWGLNVPSRDAKDRSVLQDRSHHALHQSGSPRPGQQLAWRVSKHHADHLPGFCSAVVSGASSPSKGSLLALAPLKPADRSLALQSKVRAGKNMRQAVCVDHQPPTLQH